MKRLFVMMTIMPLLLLSLNAYAQSYQKSAGAPPVSQALVPEGDFALKLATALKVGAPNDEAQAEDMLTSAGIAPKNGWIADYPVTPNIIGELQNAVATAADSKKLPMEKEEALKAFQGLTTEFGLVVAPGSGQYAESQPPTSSEYVQPQELNNYYYEEGPPVVTYYPPPWDYYYLYGWVPYPFWCSGFFFPGFFVLNDFDLIVAGHHHHRITNHFFDSRTHTLGRVDPVRHTLANVSHATAFNSTATRNAASSIFNHSVNSGDSRTFSNSSSFAKGSGMDHGSSSCANCHGGSSSFGHGSSHSFSGFSGGHSSGGFSGGHSFGGFSGGHGGGGGRR